jgi:F5/8 type C domain
MKRFLLIFSFLITFCLSAHSQASGLADLKFGQYQIADSQWNVSACMYTATCQIYSKQPGTAYKIPWYNGQLSWAAGDYVKFVQTADSTNPWNAIQYNSAGTQKAVMGTGHIINMGTDYFFFVGNDNNTGQLFSMTQGFANTDGVTWTGTLNPTIAQTNTYATGGSTTPLAAGQTAAPAGPPAPVPTAIYINSQTVNIIRSIPTSNNSPSNEGSANAFDNNPYTKYLNFDKQNAGVTVQLNAGRVVTSFKLTTANDAVERDPSSYKLYGSNDGSTWTLIQQGQLSLSDNRFSVSADISVTNSTAYVYYFMIFPTIKNDAGNSVQIAEITYFYDANNTTTSTATSNTVVDPTTAAANTLCCGGSAAAFNANATNTAKVQAFVNRTTADSKVNIEQIGTQNVVTVDQSGTKNNYVDYYGNGLSNAVNITQTGNATTQVNYVDLRVVGNFNAVDLQQTSTGGAKGIFADVSGNNNSLIVQQKDSGSHYAEVTLSGGNKNVDITQQGAVGHMAKVTLSGTGTDLSLTQSGNTQNYYSITHNCTTVGGCAPITVTQGR